MKLKFTVSERLSSDCLFPEKEDKIILRLARGIKDKLSLSSEEIKGINLKIINSQQGSSYTWDEVLADKINRGYKADFTEVEIRFLKERVNKLHDAKGIPDTSLEICEKISDIKAEIPTDKTSGNNKDKTPEEASKQK